MIANASPPPLLFSSWEFIFFFLPLVLLAFYKLRSTRQTISLLLFASLLWYSAWDWRLLPMLLVSVLVNWQLALLLSRIRSKLLLTITIATDLAPLVYFKYLTFAFDAVGRNPADWIQADFIPAILPLGISFYTFQQIAYAVDIYKGQPPQRSFISTHSSSLSFHNSWPAPLSITPSCYLRSTRSQTAPLSCCGALFTF